MAITSLSRQADLTEVIFKSILVIDSQVNLCEIALRWLQMTLTNDKSNIGSGYGTKPLPEQILTQIYVAKWHQ